MRRAFASILVTSLLACGTSGEGSTADAGSSGGLPGSDGATPADSGGSDAAGTDGARDGSADAAGEPDSGSGAMCGGIGGSSCPQGEYCDYPINAMCGAADGTGTCMTIPSICPTVCSTVCGCDGKAYCNACKAHAAGVSVRKNGGC